MALLIPEGTAYSELLPEISELVNAQDPTRFCRHCGSSFQRRGRRLYCNDKCQKDAENRRAASKRAAKRKANEPNTLLGRVTAHLGSRDCTNCQSTYGQRWAFWYDDADKDEEVMETAMLLCSRCWPLLCRQKSRERGLIRWCQALAGEGDVSWESLTEDEADMALNVTFDEGSWENFGQPYVSP